MDNTPVEPMSADVRGLVTGGSCTDFVAEMPVPSMSKRVLGKARSRDRVETAESARYMYRCQLRLSVPSNVLTIRLHPTRKKAN